MHVKASFGLACLTPLTWWPCEWARFPLAIGLIRSLCFPAGLLEHELDDTHIESTPPATRRTVGSALTLIGGTVGGTFRNLLTATSSRARGYIPGVYGSDLCI